jgi:hypothetical protein
MRYTLFQSPPRSSWWAVPLAIFRTDSLQARRDSIRVDSVARARQDSINRATPGYVVDSLLPPEEEARASEPPPRRQRDGLRRRRRESDALVRRFVRSLAASDTSALRRMVVTRGSSWTSTTRVSCTYAVRTTSPWLRLADDPERERRGLSQAAAACCRQPLIFVSERCEPEGAARGAVDRYTGCLVESSTAAATPCQAPLRLHRLVPGRVQVPQLRERHVKPDPPAKCLTLYGAASLIGSPVRPIGPRPDTLRPSGRADRSPIRVRAR